MEMCGILVSLALLIFLVYRGVGIIPASLFCSLIILVTNGLNLWEGMVGAYMGGFTGFATGFFFVFVLGSWFGQTMSDSGIARSLSLKIIDVVGRDKAVLILILINLVLTYGGINAFIVIFTSLPIARSLFYEAKLPKSLLVASIGLAGTISVSTLPGNPSVQNIIPTTFLGTDLYAAPLMGIVCTVIWLIPGYLYLQWRGKRCLKKGVPESQLVSAAEAKGSVADENLPPWYFGVISIAVVIGSIVVIQSMKWMNATATVCVASVLGILVTYALGWNKYQCQINTMNTGLMNGVIPLINACGIIAFGAVVQNTPAFQGLVNAVMSLDMNPYITTYLACNILAGVCGSGSGGLRIFMETMGQRILATGVNPAAMHRLSLIGSVGLDSLPHNCSIVSAFSIVGTNHKDSYWDYCVVTVIMPLIVGLVAVTMAVLLY